MWVEGFPRGPGECGVGRWIDYSCVRWGLKIALQLSRRMYLLWSHRKAAVRDPGASSRWEQAKRQSFFWARCSLERQTWAAEQGTCSCLFALCVQGNKTLCTFCTINKHHCTKEMLDSYHPSYCSGNNLARPHVLANPRARWR